MTIHEKLCSDYYKNHKPWADVRGEEGVKVRQEHRAEQSRLDERFKEDALEEVGLKGHPKADKAYALAWERGHANGYAEVFQELRELAELLLS